MNNFKLEPFLWLHFSGLVVIPLSLEGLWLSLSLSSPLAFWGLDFLIVAGLGIIPVFFLQFKHPLNIFSFLLLAIYPNLLTLEQRKILTLFKDKNQRIVQIITAIISLIILFGLYYFAPVATLVTNNFPQNRILAIILSSFFLGVTLFFAQVVMGIFRIFLTSQAKFDHTEPYAIERIYVDFLTPPFFVKKIIPLINN